MPKSFDIVAISDRLQSALVEKAAVVDTALLTSLEAWEHVYAAYLMGRADNPASLAAYAENLRGCYAELYGTSGNLKDRFWATDEGRVLGKAFKILYGSEWIDHTDAVGMLAGVIKDPSEWGGDKTREYPRLKNDLTWLHDRVLYPSRHSFKKSYSELVVAPVIAYYDVDMRIFRWGGRVRRSEVLNPAIREMWGNRYYRSRK